MIQKSAFYSTTQAAEILGVHRTTLYRWVREGLLKCGVKRRTGRRFFTGYELVRFINREYNL